MQRKSAVTVFVDNERAKGVGDLDIQHKLLDAGWHMDIIHWALGKPTGERAQPLVADPQAEARRTKELLWSGLFIISIISARKFLPHLRLAKSK